MRKFLWILPSLALMVAVSAQADTAKVEQPNELVKAVSGEILPLIKAKHAYYAADPNRLYAMVNKRILPYFDFRMFAQYILGLSWRTATEAQKQEAANEFRKLLVRTYATALLKYRDQDIEYLPYTGQPTDQVVFVKTRIKQSDGTKSKLTFTFANHHPGWKVFDIITDTGSLIQAYRNVYRTRIEQQGLDAVLKHLAMENRKAEEVAAGKKQ